MAQVLAIKDIADINIFDIVDGVAQGKALDIQEGAVSVMALERVPSDIRAQGGVASAIL